MLPGITKVLSMPVDTHLLTDKAYVASLFDSVADTYERPSLRFYPFAADRMVYRLRVAPGEKVLDVATGPGTAALAAARLVGATGRVMGTDIAEGMLDRASESAQRQGLRNVDWHTMDAQYLEFRSAYFDVLMCGAGVVYLEDMPGALKEWRRVLKPGGRLMLTGFDSGAFQPMADILVDMLRAWGADMPLHGPALVWQRLSGAQQYQALLSDAGLAQIDVDTEQLGYHLNGVDDWWEVVWNSDLRALVERLPAGEVGRFRAAYQETLLELVTANGMWMDVETIFASGKHEA